MSGVTSKEGNKDGSASPSKAPPSKTDYRSRVDSDDDDDDDLDDLDGEHRVDGADGRRA